MKGEHISDAFGLIEDDIIEETQRARVKVKNVKVRRIAMVAAACLCLALGGAALLQNAGSELPSVPPGDDVEPPWSQAGACGLAKVTMSEIKKEQQNNPWHEDMELETLPVYTNPYANGAGAPMGLVKEAMERKLEMAARCLGLSMENAEYETAENFYPGIAPDTPVLMRIWSEEKILRVYGDGEIDVSFQDGLPFSQIYKLTDLCSYGDLNGSDTEKILDYHFKRIRTVAQDGKLTFIAITDKLSSVKKVGDFKTISVEEAKQKLLAGEYKRGHGYVNENAVAAVELVYFGGVTEQLLAPYYCFYVEAPKEAMTDDTTYYEMYHVLAVEGNIE